MTRSDSRNVTRAPLFWLAILAVLTALAGIAGPLIGALGTRGGWWHFSTGLTYAEWGVYAAGIALALSLILIIVAWRHKSPALWPAALGLALALPMVAMAIHWQFAATRFAAINDISTDTEDPPMFWEVPNPMDYPGAATAKKQHAGYPDLAPLNLTAPAPAVFQATSDLVVQRGWELVAADPDEGRIEAIAYSTLFGFADEVVLRITSDGDTTLVDMRSHSRVGGIDRGVNAKRIEAFLSDLRAMVAP